MSSIQIETVALTREEIDRLVARAGCAVCASPAGVSPATEDVAGP